MSRMIRKRWKSKFARFVQAYGVESLALELDVRSSAIYHWIRDAYVRPRNSRFGESLQMNYTGIGKQERDRRQQILAETALSLFTAASL